jgi:hypothetical protein
VLLFVDFFFFFWKVDRHSIPQSVKAIFISIASDNKISGVTAVTQEIKSGLQLGRLEISQHGR